MLFGAPVVIADFTATRSCDAASMRRLLDVEDRAPVAWLQFAIPPGPPVRRLAVQLDPAHRVPVYASPAEAAAEIPRPAPR